MAVKVTWDKLAISHLLKTDEGIAAALQAQGDAIAVKNSIRALKNLHSPVYVQPYIAEHRVLKHTQAVVVHSTTKAVAASGRAHGLPKK